MIGLQALTIIYTSEKTLRLLFLAIVTALSLQGCTAIGLYSDLKCDDNRSACKDNATAAGIEADKAIIDSTISALTKKSDNKVYRLECDETETQVCTISSDECRCLAVSDQ
ncbi:Uncharacterised protein [BD1-7 clade bacterium]|uniref:Uncharacterized protein n=1 Tax=BD1-7 clade bacterium TaxID=2029982 RepID=A0A5S9PKB3_9GAMM|nr:Uncharacterised protein [BD1-7 clade bacterium]CAA0104359.1 Uncharacterised protein [BD1-7 clade bacterium]